MKLVYAEHVNSICIFFVCTFRKSFAQTYYSSIPTHHCVHWFSGVLSTDASDSVVISLICLSYSRAESDWVVICLPYSCAESDSVVICLPYSRAESDSVVICLPYYRAESGSVVICLPYYRAESDSMVICLPYSRAESDSVVICLPYSRAESDSVVICCILAQSLTPWWLAHIGVKLTKLHYN